MLSLIITGNNKKQSRPNNRLSWPSRQLPQPRHRPRLPLPRPLPRRHRTTP